jgi:hypothetical protein
MVIHDFDIKHLSIFPNKAHAPLVVDAYAPLPLAIGFQRFQPIPRRNTQIVQARCPMHHQQLALGHGAEGQPAAMAALPGKQGLGILALE